jgi:hypothetical protein
VFETIFTNQANIKVITNFAKVIIFIEASSCKVSIDPYVLFDIASLAFPHFGTMSSMKQYDMNLLL